MLLVNSAPSSGESWALAGELCEDLFLTTKLRVNFPKQRANVLSVRHSELAFRMGFIADGALEDIDNKNKGQMEELLLLGKKYGGPSRVKFQ